jgi:cell volume regulation protein A
MYQIILSVGLLIFFAHALSYIFKKTFIPDVLILIIFGILLGPILHYINPSDFGKIGSVITTIALVVILFESGCSLNFKVLMSSFKTSGYLTLITFFSTAAIVTTLSYAFLELNYIASLMLGVILGGTSSAVVVPITDVLNISAKTKTTLLLESAATDVLCILTLFSLIEFFELNQAFNILKFISSIGTSFVMAIVLGFISGTLWLIIIDKLKNFPNTLTTTIAWLFIIYGITESLGYSGPIAALAFGLILTNYQSFSLINNYILAKHDIKPLTKVELDFYKELVFLLKIFFFIYLGIQFEIKEYNLLVFSIILVVLIFVARIPVTKVLFKNDPFEDKSYISMMAPKGLAAAVLASIPFTYNIEGSDQIIDIVSMVVIFSIILCALLVVLFRFALFKKLYQKFF